MKNKIDGLERIAINCAFSNGQRIEFRGKYVHMTNSLDFSFEDEYGKEVDLKPEYCLQLETVFASLAEAFGGMAKNRDVTGEDLDGNDSLQKMKGFNGLFDNNPLAIIRFNIDDEKEERGEYTGGFSTWSFDEMTSYLEKQFGKVTLIEETETEIRYTYKQGEKTGRLLLTFERLATERYEISKRPPRTHGKIFF